MNKVLIFGALALFGVSFTFASAAVSCTDLTKNVSRYQESASVLSLQNFLKEKGFLTAVPNGYFGNGTFIALKAYQKSLGFSQVGIAGPATRAAIKSETCASGSAKPVVSPSTAPASSTPLAPSTTVSSLPQVTAQSPSQIRNTRRTADVEKILTAMYRYNSESFGTNITRIAVSDKPVELCVAPNKFSATTTGAEGARVLTTDASPCKDVIDISYLTPAYLADVPRDPSLATTSAVLGYTVTRSEYNDIVIAAKSPEQSAIIKITCNFNSYCKNIRRITDIEYAVPSITKIDNTILVKDAVQKTIFTITGKGLTKKNTVILQSKSTQRDFVLGEFSSENGTTLLVNGSSTLGEISCGDGCKMPINLEDYSVRVKNEGGSSNLLYVTFKNYTSSALSANNDQSVRAKSKNVKLATVTISAGTQLKLSSFKVEVATSTSKTLSAKITNFVAKDLIGNINIPGGSGSFNLSDAVLGENVSKVYSVYADIGDVLVSDAGYITYKTTFTVKNPLTGAEMSLPGKEFSFTVTP